MTETTPPPPTAPVLTEEFTLFLEKDYAGREMEYGRRIAYIPEDKDTRIILHLSPQEVKEFMHGPIGDDGTYPHSLDAGNAGDAIHFKIREDGALTPQAKKLGFTTASPVYRITCNPKTGVVGIEYSNLCTSAEVAETVATLRKRGGIAADVSRELARHLITAKTLLLSSLAEIVEKTNELILAPAANSTGCEMIIRPSKNGQTTQIFAENSRNLAEVAASFNAVSLRNAVPPRSATFQEHDGSVQERWIEVNASPSITIATLGDTQHIQPAIAEAYLLQAGTQETSKAEQLATEQQQQNPIQGRG